MSRLVLESSTRLTRESAFALGSQLRLHCARTSRVVLALWGTRWRLYAPDVIVVSSVARACLGRLWCAAARLQECRFVDDDDDTEWRAVAVFDERGEETTIADDDDWCSVDLSTKQLVALALDPDNNYLQLCSTVAVEDEACFRRCSLAALLNDHSSVPWSTHNHCIVEAAATIDVVVIDPFNKDTDPYYHEGVLLVSDTTTIFSVIVRSPPCCNVAMTQMRVVAMRRRGEHAHVWRVCVQCEALALMSVVALRDDDERCLAPDIARRDKLCSVRPTNWLDLPSEAVLYPDGLTDGVGRRVDAESVAHVLSTVPSLAWTGATVGIDAPPLLVHDRCDVGTITAAISATTCMLICTVSALRTEWWQDRIKRDTGVRCTSYNGSVIGVSARVTVSTPNSLWKMPGAYTHLVIEHPGRLCEVLFDAASILDTFRERTVALIADLVRRVGTLYVVGEGGANGLLLDAAFLAWLKTLRHCTLVDAVHGAVVSTHAVVEDGCTGFLRDSDDDDGCAIEEDVVEEEMPEAEVIETTLVQLCTLVRQGEKRVAIFASYDNMLPGLTQQCAVGDDVLLLTKGNKSQSRVVAGDARAWLRGVRVLLLSPSAAVCIDYRHFDVLAVVHLGTGALLPLVQQAMACVRTPLVYVLPSYRQSLTIGAMPTLGQLFHRSPRGALLPLLVEEARTAGSRLSRPVFRQWLHDRQRRMATTIAPMN